MTPPSDQGAAGAALPPAAPGVVAEAVEGLTSRLRKKLDAAIEQYAAAPMTREGDGPASTLSITCGEDAVVTLTPGPDGALANADQVRCSCLLAPRCLHRAAVLSACPVASGSALEQQPDASGAPAADGAAVAESAIAGSSAAATAATDVDGPAAPTEPAPPTPAQLAAASALWSAAAAVLAAGIPAAGAVPQAELLRAAHTARLAGLHRAEAAALRVVRGLRSARARHDSHRLADLVAALRELLLTSGLLAAADPDAALIGTARRAYQPPGGALRVYGVCREPIISATGYGGVVTHMVGEDGRWYSVADVRPGGAGRARAAANAPVSLGPATLDHAALARRGLLISGATVSPEGRLGAGKGVKATPIAGLDWSAGAMAALLARPLAEAAADRLSVATAAGGDEDAERAEAERKLVACDVAILGAYGDHVLAVELCLGPDTGADGEPGTGTETEAGTANPADGPTGALIRLVPANGHPDLAHTDNLRRLASRPGLRIRVVGRLDPDRAATLLPLAVGPIPGSAATLRLPDAWSGHADLGYDRFQGAHLPPAEECPSPPPITLPLDPTAESPLWRYHHLVELAVSGGRRAVGEYARAATTTGRRTVGKPETAFIPLRTAGFHTAAVLATALAAEADRRDRDAFGRLTDPGTDRYARAWLAAAAHLAGTERALVLASWSGAG